MQRAIRVTYLDHLYHLKLLRLWVVPPFLAARRRSYRDAPATAHSQSESAECRSSIRGAECTKQPRRRMHQQQPGRN